MTTQLRWFLSGVLALLEIAALYFMFTHQSTPWSGVIVSMGLLLGSVNGFLLLQSPNFSYAEKTKQRLQKTYLVIGALMMTALPFETIKARNKQAHNNAINIEIARLDAQIKRLKAQNAELNAELDAREKSR